jgi:hypothetical protein
MDSDHTGACISMIMVDAPQLKLHTVLKERNEYVICSYESRISPNSNFLKGMQILRAHGAYTCVRICRYVLP